MAELSSRKRKKLPSSSFVCPKKRGFPIHDKAHGQAALRLCGRAKPSKFGFKTNKALCAAVKRKVCRRYPGISACKRK